MTHPTTGKPIRAALYLRVSTRDQSTERQRSELEALAAAKGYVIAGIYEDAGISGAKGRDQRPAFDRLLTDAARRRFDVVLAWAIDRLGRSTADLLETLRHFHAVGVDLDIAKQGLDTRTPAGKAMFGMLGIFAEFEREVIRERVQSGVDRARARGVRIGRPATDAATVAAIRADLGGGMSFRKVAARHGVALSTVQKVHAGAPAPGAPSPSPGEEI